MDTVAVGEAFEEVGNTKTMREDVRTALAELSTRQRQVLTLQYLAGLDEIAVSEALGISVRAVRRYAAQGRAALVWEPAAL